MNLNFIILVFFLLSDSGVCKQTGLLVEVDVLQVRNFLTLLLCVLGVIAGRKTMWIVGDNFMAKTVRVNFDKAEEDYYIKNNFQIIKNCNSRYSSNNTNLLSRFVNSLISLLNTQAVLPEYILLILDNDIIQFFEYEKPRGVTSLLGNWIEWCVQAISKAISERIGQLPGKALNEDPPQLYWVSCPLNKSFRDNDLRIKFNLAMETVMKTVPNMRVIKLKDRWNHDDSNLVSNERLTVEGEKGYWRVINSAVQFNVHKHNEFVVVDKYHKLMEQRKRLREESTANITQRLPVKRSLKNEFSDSGYGKHVRRDDMQQFFRRHSKKNRDNDRFHWNRRNEDNFNRFALPHLQNM